MTPTSRPDTDLRARAFFIADHAAVENGRAYVNGGFTTQLGFPSFPALATFAIVAVLEVPWRAYHQPHRFEVAFLDADGQRFPQHFGGEFRVGAGPDMRVGDPTVMPIAATISNLPIQQAGDYSAVLEVDGAELERWPIRVSQVFQPTSVPPPQEFGDPTA